MITLNNVSFAVGDKMVLHPLSVQWPMGNIHLIIGPNGAGKSTLIKLISMQLKPTTGTVYFGGKEASTLPLEQLAIFRAVLSQSNELAFPLTAQEIVMMGRYPHFKSQPSLRDAMAVEEAMRFFEIKSFADRNYLTLSGGEKQRVQFARVLAQLWHVDGPRYLLLDEPLTFLDIHYQIQFMQQLKTLLANGNLMVLGVLHDLNLAARFADSILLLNKGLSVAYGLPQQVLSKENLKAAFQLDTEKYFDEKTNKMYLLY
jgi:iron complex transport system ATP-binding protein